MTIAADDRRSSTLVWIDAREAVIVRLHGDRLRLERIESEVPAHHRATGHVRHDPAVRRGGGGSPQSAGEPHRIEHLDRFVGDISSRLAASDNLLILGPGTVHERLGRHLSESDRRRGQSRDIACEASPPMTDRQLIARLRRFVGVEPRRRSVGAYRWGKLSRHRPSGQADLPPRRVVDKPPRDRGQEAPGE
jgi:hypothetical protein